MMRGYFLLAGLCFVLIGCGIKPSEVLPPEGAEESQHPATYPKPEADK